MDSVVKRIEVHLKDKALQNNLPEELCLSLSYRKSVLIWQNDKPLKTVDWKYTVDFLLSSQSAQLRKDSLHMNKS